MSIASQVPRALAIVNGGNALATVIAAPLGSFLGGLIGWRGAFFCVVPVAVVAVLWLLLSLPSITPRSQADNGNLLRLIKRAPVALGMLAVSVFFMGQFMLFTYLRPFLETVTQVSAATLSLMLLVLGVAGFVGTFLIERFLQQSAIFLADRSLADGDLRRVVVGAAAEAEESTAGTNLGAANDLILVEIDLGLIGLRGVGGHQGLPGRDLAGGDGGDGVAGPQHPLHHPGLAPALTSARAVASGETAAARTPAAPL